MIASLTDLWTQFDAPQTRSRPEPARRSGPVLIGDILASRGSEPEFLARWREDRDAAQGD